MFFFIKRLKILRSTVVKHPITHKTLFKYGVGGVDVCEDIFRTANGITQNAWKRAKASIRKNEESVPRQKRSDKSLCARRPQEQSDVGTERYNQTKA